MQPITVVSCANLKGEIFELFLTVTGHQSEKRWTHITTHQPLGAQSHAHGAGGVIAIIFTVLGLELRKSRIQDTLSHRGFPVPGETG